MIGSVGRSLRRVVDALQRSLFDDANGASAAPSATLLQGARVATLLGRRVPWTLRRSRRRSIGFVVGTDGLVVTAPNRVALRDVERALQEKARWVVARIDEQAGRRDRADAARIVWASGVAVPYLGQPMCVVVDPELAEAVRFVAASAGSDAELRVGLPRDASPDRLRDAVQSWLQRQATALFAERCRHFEAALGVRVRSVRLSSAKTRWGSATARGDVRLHWRLVHFTPPTIDYVVAHELAHLREMNHGPRFWTLVEGVADADAGRRALRSAELPAWD